MRLCSACKTYKNEEEFNRKGQGYQSQCRLCQRAWYKDYYDTVPKERQRLLKKNNETRSEIRSKIQKIKESSPCTDCGNYFPYYVMDFDHQHSKKYSIANMVSLGSWELIEKEMAKCELVCSNCHRIRTHSPLV